MHTYRLLALAFVGSLAGCIAAEDPEASDFDGRSESAIVGGSTFTGLPAVGSLVYNGKQRCTGTLIAPRKVLTAAHCLDDRVASGMRFVIGNDIWSPAATLAVSRFEQHPKWDRKLVVNDIAIVHLASDAPVAPMGVVTKMDASWVGRTLLFVGYGLAGVGKGGAGVKRSATMAISRVEPTRFRYDDPRMNTCQGDSGGPALFKTSAGNYLVAGVTSNGDAKCAAYGNDTRVDAFLDFVQPSSSPAASTPAASTPAASTPAASTPAASTPAGGNACGAETWQGRCSGTTVVWCEKNAVKRTDCTARGMVCGFDKPSGAFGCVAPDPCKGETFEGRCTGSVVTWCESKQPKSLDCKSRGLSCGFVSSKGYYACQ